MGSIGEDKPVMGEFYHPVITPETKNSDPLTRNYYQPPDLGPLVPRKYPLIDIRPLLEKPDYTPMGLLQTHGFGVVKHHSAFVDKVNNEELDQTDMTDIYFPEIEELVLKTTGAKKAFFSISTFRQGKRTPGPYKMPSGRGLLSDAKDNGDVAAKQEHKMAGQSVQSKLSLGAPIRVPHMDHTPLGVRNTIRFQDPEFHAAAEASGILALEDGICKDLQHSAAEKEVEALIAERYNQGGQLGPRYAAYSIWRPLRKVGRDPIALASRREMTRADGERVYWPYWNRIPGPADFHGDYHREFAMLGVKSKEAPPAGAEDGDLKWYYMSEQGPEDVLFIKLFDSAALGETSAHAGAPWHASPEIGDAAGGDEPRESIDIRVTVFW